MVKLVIILVLASLVALAAASYPRAGKDCSSDADCWEEFELCTEAQICKHRDLFPIRGIEIGGMFFLAFLVAFANFGGLAGGMAYLAFLLMFKFSVPIAIVISNS